MRKKDGFYPMLRTISSASSTIAQVIVKCMNHTDSSTVNIHTTQKTAAASQKNTSTTLESSLLYPEEAFSVAGDEGRVGRFVLFAPSGKATQTLGLLLACFPMMAAIRMVSIINNVFGGGRLSYAGNRKKLSAGRW